MERFERNKDFLNSLIKGTKIKKINIVMNASEDELRSVIEVALNVRSLPSSTKENKLLSPTIKYLRLFRKTRWTVGLAKKLIIRNLDSLKIWLKFVLAKVIELSVCGLLNNG
jgi:hypothetical protein